MTRALLGIAAAVAALLVVPASGLAAEVRVIAKDGREFAFDLAASAGAEDVDAEYTIRSSASDAEHRRIAGFSVEAVLSGAVHQPTGDTFDAFSFTYVELRRPGGGSVLLSNRQVREAGYYDEGPPVIYADGARVGFVRPQRDPDDINASDSFSAPGPLVIEEGSGGLVEVELHASTTRPKVGQRVSFTAEVTRQGAGQALEFRWSFGDDTPIRTGSQEVAHSFSRRGCYGVGLGVYEDGDSLGGDSVRILVESPESACDDDGGDDGDGPPKRKPKPDDDPGSPGPGDGSGDGDGDDDGTGANDGAGDDEGGGRSSRRERDRGARRPAGDDRVDGELLSDPGAPGGSEAARQDPEPPSPTTPPPDEATGRSGPGGSGIAVGLLVTAGLLGAGALRELGRLPGGDFRGAATRVTARVRRWFR